LFGLAKAARTGFGQGTAGGGLVTPRSGCSVRIPATVKANNPQWMHYNEDTTQRKPGKLVCFTFT